MVVGRRSPSARNQKAGKSRHGTLVVDYMTPLLATVTTRSSTAILFTLWCQFLPQKKLF